MKQELVNAATKQIAKIQEELGTNAKVFIGSDDVAKVITQATEETSADLLVVGSLGTIRNHCLWDYPHVARSCIERIELPTSAWSTKEDALRDEHWCVYEIA